MCAHKNTRRRERETFFLSKKISQNFIIFIKFLSFLCDRFYQKSTFIIIIKTTPPKNDHLTTTTQTPPHHHEEEDFIVAWIQNHNNGHWRYHRGKKEGSGRVDEEAVHAGGSGGVFRRERRARCADDGRRKLWRSQKTEPNSFFFFFRSLSLRLSLIARASNAL